jgi:hypothetical protein
VDFFIFSLLNPSSRTMAMGSTQPLTEISTRNFPGGKGRLASKADDFTAICELSRKYENLDVSQPYVWAFTACYRDSFTFLACKGTS